MVELGANRSGVLRMGKAVTDAVIDERGDDDGGTCLQTV